MNIQDIEYISAVAAEGSVNKAAKKLFVAQPSLSKCIRRVEQEYGVTLFGRNRGSLLELTAEGQCFLDMAQEMLSAHEPVSYTHLDVSKRQGVRTPLATGHITKMIYPEVARQYQTSVSSVERSIRHSVDVIWERGNRELYYYLSGQYGRGKPTNSEFVSYLAEYIRFVDDCGRNLLS